jgi:Flp pilus assembly pilin Flp
MYDNARVVRLIRKSGSFFRRNDTGQDLAEYCLLTALIALIALGIMYRLSGGLEAVWGTASTTIASGTSVSGTSASGGSGTSSAQANPADGQR